MVDQWTAFLAEAPDTDDAEDWVARHPLRIPLLNLLFSGTAPVAQPAAAATPLKKRDRVSEPLDSVNWSRCGVKRRKGDPAEKASSRVIQGPAGVTQSIPIDWVDTAVGRKAVAPPKQPAPPKKPAPRKQVGCCSDESCGGDSDCDDLIEYESAVRVTRGASARFFQRIGSQFYDKDERKSFRIVDVCSSNKFGGHFFKYIILSDITADSVDPDDYEYTPCQELMKAEWKEWVEEERIDDSVGGR